MTHPNAQTPSLSFEFYPPHTTDGAFRLWTSVERLAPLSPAFVSVTYGAGGTTRERTMAAIRAIGSRARLSVAGHLTCVGASREETLAVAEEYKRLGVTRIVALRGDPPKGEGKFEPHPDGFASSLELIEAVAGLGGLQIQVSAYPEPHPETKGQQADIDHLKAKFDAGASSAITQFFFDNEDFLRFRDKCAAAGITAPVHPGILPVENFVNLTRFAARCGATIPDWMHQAFGRAEMPEEAELLATAICAEQCDELLEEGVEHLHFYTLNKPDLTFNTCRALGIQADGLALAAGQVA